jgi:transaldolase
MVLAASIRNVDQFYDAIFNGADILTVPYKVLQEWVHQEKWIPDEHYRSPVSGLKTLLYKDLEFHEDFTKYEITNEKGSLLAEGLERFDTDWNSIIKG